jgi:hypothetical protein
MPRKLPLKFAQPGAERQDSVCNGFQAIDGSAQVCTLEFVNMHVGMGADLCIDSRSDVIYSHMHC